MQGMLALSLALLSICLGAANAAWVPPKPVTSHGNRLLHGQQILRPAQLVSQDGSTVLSIAASGDVKLLRDGNLVWASFGTWHTVAVDIPTGAFETRSPTKYFRYTSNYTNLADKDFPNRLVVQNDGNMVIYDRDGKERWSTNTARPDGGERTPDGDTFAPDWKVPATYVEAPESPTDVPDRSRCPITTLDAPGLDGLNKPLSSFMLCPPCEFVTSMTLTAQCDLTGVVSFECSGGSTVVVQGDRAVGERFAFGSRTGFSAASAGAVPGTSITGLVHVVFTKVPLAPTSFGSALPAPIEIANPFRKDSYGRPACDRSILRGEKDADGAREVKSRRDLHRVTCSGDSRIVGLRAEVSEGGSLEFSVVCGSAIAPPIEPNPCSDPEAIYNTVTQQCYKSACPAGTSLFTCGNEPDKQYCLSNAGVLCEDPYVMFGADNLPIAFVCEEPYPCEVSKLCTSIRQCFPPEKAPISDCAFIPTPQNPTAEIAFDPNLSTLTYLDTFRNFFVQPNPPLGPQGVPTNSATPPNGSVPVTEPSGPSFAGPTQRSAAGSAVYPVPLGVEGDPPVTYV